MRSARPSWRSSKIPASRSRCGRCSTSSPFGALLVKLASGAQGLAQGAERYLNGGLVAWRLEQDCGNFRATKIEMGARPMTPI